MPDENSEFIPVETESDDNESKDEIAEITNDEV